MIYKVYVIIGFCLFVCSCSPMDKKAVSEVDYIHDDIETEHPTTNVTEEINEIENNGNIKVLNIDLKGVEDVVAQKLQEIIDLNKLIKDSTLPKEMRVEAKKALQKITGEGFESDLTEGKIRRLQIERNGDSTFAIRFYIENIEKIGIATVKKEIKHFKDEKVETLEVIVEEIK